MSLINSQRSVTIFRLGLFHVSHHLLISLEELAFPYITDGEVVRVSSLLEGVPEVQHLKIIQYKLYHNKALKIICVFWVN